MKKVHSLLFVILFGCLSAGSFADSKDDDRVQVYSEKALRDAKFGDKVFLEVYLNAFYSYNKLTFANSVYNSFVSKEMPANFGGGVGFIMNDILFLELDIFGGSNKIGSSVDSSIDGGKANTVFLRTNAGLRVPLFTNKFAVLLHAGALTYFQTSRFNYTANTVPRGLSDMNVGVMPEFGIGLEYRFTNRLSVKLEGYYAFVAGKDVSKMLGSVMTIQTGLSLKI